MSYLQFFAFVNMMRIDNDEWNPLLSQVFGQIKPVVSGGLNAKEDVTLGMLLLKLLHPLNQLFQSGTGIREHTVLSQFNPRKSMARATWVSLAMSTPTTRVLSEIRVIR